MREPELGEDSGAIPCQLQAAPTGDLTSAKDPPWLLPACEVCGGERGAGSGRAAHLDVLSVTMSIGMIKHKALEKPLVWVDGHLLILGHGGGPEWQQS